MMLVSAFVFAFVSLVLANKDTYKAAIVGVSNEETSSRNYVNLIHEAGNLNVDIIVLSSEITKKESYDKAIKTISEAAKDAAIYVVVHLPEKMRCQDADEIIRSNLVFDRQGNLVSVYRKPVNALTNCTDNSNDVTIFSTDFGVTFGLLMEEDLALKSGDCSRDIRNFVVAGSWPSEIPFLSSSQFSTSWAFAKKANLLSSAGIFAGQAGIQTEASQLNVALLNKYAEQDEVFPPSYKVSSEDSIQDLNRFTIKPVDLEAVKKGYMDTVCHGVFCCEFFVKARIEGNKENSVSYSLAAFDGAQKFDRTHNIGAQSCTVVACAGTYKKTCSFGSGNHTSIVFDKITITSNFSSQNSAQYPVLLANSPVNTFAFIPETNGKNNKITTEVTDASNLYSFGIFGRVFSKDYENYDVSSYQDTEDVFEGEEQEFFDYFWIRFRILLVVVSIYVLEQI